MKYLLENIKDKNEILFYFGTICLLLAIISLVLTLVTSTQIMGVNAWLKPFKFFLSTTIFSWTMALYLNYLANQNQVFFFSWSVIIFLTIELALIVFQSSRGKTSHFNRETLLDKTIFNIMGLAIILLMFHTLYMAFLFFYQKHFTINDNLVLSIKLSFLIMVLFAFEGFVMGAFLKHTIGSQDGSEGLPIVNWSKKYGDLRVAHFFGMHALQIIPLLTYLLAKTKRDVIIITSIYFIFVSFTLIQALKGKSLIEL